MKYKILGTFTGKVEKLSNNIESAITKRPKDKLIIKKESFNDLSISIKSFSLSKPLKEL